MNQFVDDRDEDPRLPSRGSDRRSAAQEHLQDDSDREFTLSTGTVLGLFFALALLCAVFFGFGYTLGHKSGVNSAEAAVQPAPVVNDSPTPKPSPASPVVQTIPGYQSSGPAEGTSRTGAASTSRTSSAGSTTVVVPIAPPPAARATSATATTETTAPSKPAPVVRVPAPAVEHSTPAATVPSTPAPVAGTGATYVQIAAVSHQEDANVLLSALRRRGYTVFTRPGDADKLIHVQVGPFATKKDADAMRERLRGDGYNAIIK